MPGNDPLLQLCKVTEQDPKFLFLKKKYDQKEKKYFVFNFFKAYSFG